MFYRWTAAVTASVSRAIVVAACLSGLLATTAKAEIVGQLIGVQKGFPDIDSGWVSGGYSAGYFAAYGVPQAFSTSTDSSQDIAGDSPSFAIEMTLTDPSVATPMNATGTISIYGSVGGGPEGLLLSGAIEQFGASIDKSIGAASVLFDIRFRVDSGSLAPLFGSVGGIILTPQFDDSMDVPFSGDFLTDFTFSGMGYADAFPVATPEPSSAALLSLMGMGLGTLVCRRFWMRRISG